jgi:hypothetical protein
MVAHGFQRQAEVVSNLLVAPALCHQGQQLAFPVAQFWEDARGGGFEGGEEAQQAFSNGGAKDHFATGHRPNRQQLPLGLRPATRDENGLHSGQPSADEEGRLILVS